MKTSQRRKNCGTCNSRTKSEKVLRILHSKWLLLLFMLALTDSSNGQFGFPILDNVVGEAENTIDNVAGEAENTIDNVVGETRNTIDKLTGFPNHKSNLFPSEHKENGNSEELIGFGDEKVNTVPKVVTAVEKLNLDNENNIYPTPEIVFEGGNSGEEKGSDEIPYSNVVSNVENHDKPNVEQPPFVDSTVSEDASEKPNTVSEDPTTVSEGPTSVSEEPTTVIKDVSEGTTTVSEEPTTVFKDVSEGPKTVSEGPTAVSEGPISISEGPTTVSEGPISVSEGPTTVFKDVSEGTTTVSEGPTSVSEGATSVSEGPTTISESYSTSAIIKSSTNSSVSSAIPGTPIDSSSTKESSTFDELTTSPSEIRSVDSSTNTIPKNTYSISPLPITLPSAITPSKAGTIEDIKSTESVPVETKKTKEIDETKKEDATTHLDTEKITNVGIGLSTDQTPSEGIGSIESGNITTETSPVYKISDSKTKSPTLDLGGGVISTTSESLPNNIVFDEDVVEKHHTTTTLRNPVPISSTEKPSIGSKVSSNTELTSPRKPGDIGTTVKIDEDQTNYATTKSSEQSTPAADVDKNKDSKIQSSTQDIKSEILSTTLESLPNNIAFDEDVVEKRHSTTTLKQSVPVSSTETPLAGTTLTSDTALTVPEKTQDITTTAKTEVDNHTDSKIESSTQDVRSAIISTTLESLPNNIAFDEDVVEKHHSTTLKQPDPVSPTETPPAGTTLISDTALTVPEKTHDITTTAKIEVDNHTDSKIESSTQDVKSAIISTTLESLPNNIDFDEDVVEKHHSTTTLKQSDPVSPTETPPAGTTLTSDTALTVPEKTQDITTTAKVEVDNHTDSKIESSTQDVRSAFISTTVESLPNNIAFDEDVVEKHHSTTTLKQLDPVSPTETPPAGTTLTSDTALTVPEKTQDITTTAKIEVDNYTDSKIESSTQDVKSAIISTTLESLPNNIAFDEDVVEKHHSTTTLKQPDPVSPTETPPAGTTLTSDTALTVPKKPEDITTTAKIEVDNHTDSKIESSTQDVRSATISTTSESLPNNIAFDEDVVEKRHSTTTLKQSDPVSPTETPLAGTTLTSNTELTSSKKLEDITTVKTKEDEIKHNISTKSSEQSTVPADVDNHTDLQTQSSIQDFGTTIHPTTVESLPNNIAFDEDVVEKHHSTTTLKKFDPVPSTEIPLVGITLTSNTELTSFKKPEDITTVKTEEAKHHNTEKVSEQRTPSAGLNNNNDLQIESTTQKIGTTIQATTLEALPDNISFDEDVVEVHSSSFEGKNSTPSIIKSSSFSATELPLTTITMQDNLQKFASTIDTGTSNESSITEITIPEASSSVKPNKLSTSEDNTGIFTAVTEGSEHSTRHPDSKIEVPSITNDISESITFKSTVESTDGSTVASNEIPKSAAPVTEKWTTSHAISTKTDFGGPVTMSSTVDLTSASTATSNFSKTTAIFAKEELTLPHPSMTSEFSVESITTPTFNAENDNSSSTPRISTQNVSKESGTITNQETNLDNPRTGKENGTSKEEVSVNKEIPYSNNHTNETGPQITVVTERNSEKNGLPSREIDSGKESHIAEKTDNNSISNKEVPYSNHDDNGNVSQRPIFTDRPDKEHPRPSGNELGSNSEKPETTSGPINTENNSSPKTGNEDKSKVTTGGIGIDTSTENHILLNYTNRPLELDNQIKPTSVENNMINTNVSKGDSLQNLPNNGQEGPNSVELEIPYTNEVSKDDGDDTLDIPYENKVENIETTTSLEPTEADPNQETSTLVSSTTLHKATTTPKLIEGTSTFKEILSTDITTEYISTQEILSNGSTPKLSTSKNTITEGSTIVNNHNSSIITSTTGASGEVTMTVPHTSEKSSTNFQNPSTISTHNFTTISTIKTNGSESNVSNNEGFSPEYTEASTEKYLTTLKVPQTSNKTSKLPNLGTESTISVDPYDMSSTTITVLTSDKFNIFTELTTEPTNVENVTETVSTTRTTGTSAPSITTSDNENRISSVSIKEPIDMTTKIIFTTDEPNISSTPPLSATEFSSTIKTDEEFTLETGIEMTTQRNNISDVQNKTSNNQVPTNSSINGEKESKDAKSCATSALTTGLTYGAMGGSAGAIGAVFSQIVKMIADTMKSKDNSNNKSGKGKKVSKDEDNEKNNPEDVERGQSERGKGHSDDNSSHGSNQGDTMQELNKKLDKTADEFVGHVEEKINVVEDQVVGTIKDRLAETSNQILGDIKTHMLQGNGNLLTNVKSMFADGENNILTDIKKRLIETKSKIFTDVRSTIKNSIDQDEDLIQLKEIENVFKTDKTIDIKDNCILHKGLSKSVDNINERIKSQFNQTEQAISYDIEGHMEKIENDIVQEIKTKLPHYSAIISALNINMANSKKLMLKDVRGKLLQTEILLQEGIRINMNHVLFTSREALERRTSWPIVRNDYLGQTCTLETINEKEKLLLKEKSQGISEKLQKKKLDAIEIINEKLHKGKTDATDVMIKQKGFDLLKHFRKNQKPLETISSNIGDNLSGVSDPVKNFRKLSTKSF